MKKIYMVFILLMTFIMSYADNFVPTVVLKNNESHRVGFKICTPTCENPTNTIIQYIYPGNTYTISNIVGVNSGPLVTIKSLDTAYDTVVTGSNGGLSISHSQAPEFALYKSRLSNSCDTYQIYSKATTMFLSQNATTFSSSCSGSKTLLQTSISSTDINATIQINYNTNMPQ